MAHVADPPNSSELTRHETPAGRTAVQHPPVTPGKVSMWLFLATEVMFFTGLIGSYIVLRAGTPPSAYSNLFAPGTDLSRLTDHKGVKLVSAGSKPREVAETLHRAAGLDEHDAEHLVEQ